MSKCSNPHNDTTDPNGHCWHHSHTLVVGGQTMRVSQCCHCWNRVEEVLPTTGRSAGWSAAGHGPFAAPYTVTFPVSPLTDGIEGEE